MSQMYAKFGSVFFDFSEYDILTEVIRTHVKTAQHAVAEIAAIAIARGLFQAVTYVLGNLYIGTFCSR